MKTHNAATAPRMPSGKGSFAKGGTLKDLLGREAVDCLAHNIALVHRRFDAGAFHRDAVTGLDPLSIMARGQHLAGVLRGHLPQRYADALQILIKSLGPPLSQTSDFGLAVFYYLPHVAFVANFGTDSAHNEGNDPFEISMSAQRELTRRFTAEFSMRPFLIRWPERTLNRLLTWTRDADPHVRRLCSEGSRPRLPWAQRIPAFVKDPRPALPILEALKDDPELYVRRSVANHIGDIAKDHPSLAFDICERWLEDASPQRKWLIRHALRHPAKKNVKRALALRRKAA